MRILEKLVMTVHKIAVISAGIEQLYRSGRIASMRSFLEVKNLLVWLLIGLIPMLMLATWPLLLRSLRKFVLRKMSAVKRELPGLALECLVLDTSIYLLMVDSHSVPAWILFAGALASVARFVPSLGEKRPFNKRQLQRGRNKASSKSAGPTKGHLVSRSKPPRFTRLSVEQALNQLGDRIKAVNANPNDDYQITDAVAFGDFLGNAARVQAAEVGIRLAPKKNVQLIASAREYRASSRSLNSCAGKPRSYISRPTKTG